MIIGGLDQASAVRSVPLVYTQAPDGQDTSLWDGSEQHIGPLVPLKKESPMMAALLFFPN